MFALQCHKDTDIHIYKYQIHIHTYIHKYILTDAQQEGYFYAWRGALVRIYVHVFTYTYTHISYAVWCISTYICTCIYT